MQTNLARLTAMAVFVAWPALTQTTPGFYTINTVAGTSAPSGDGGPAKSALLLNPNGVTTDRAGNIYVADTGNHVVRRITPDGNITIVAGRFGTAGFVGDSGPATKALINAPLSVAVDANGNLYIADQLNRRIRKVDGNGVITTIAGTGQFGYGGDNGPALQADIGTPASVVIDSANNLYFSDSSNHVARKITADGSITTIVGIGSGGYNGDGKQGNLTQLNSPRGLAIDAAGTTLFIADNFNSRIRRLGPDGVITTVVGDGSFAFFGDNGKASLARAAGPLAVTLDSSGNLYISDTGNARIRKVDTSSTITTVAGNGTAAFTGDGALATAAGLSTPAGIALDSSGNLLVADSGNQRIRRVALATTKTIDTVAGDFHFHGENGSAATALLFNPSGAAIDSASNLYFADSGNNRVRKLTPSGIISTVAGTGIAGFSGDNGQATTAQLNGPRGVAIDGAGNVLIADTGNNRIRKVANGIITTVGGNGNPGTTGDNGSATAATIFAPTNVAVDAAGNIYISTSNKIRKITATTNIISTVAGTGAFGFAGEGTAAVNALLRSPNGIAFDKGGLLYFADSSNHIIRKIDGSGNISTVAGIPANPGSSGDGGPANQARLSGPVAIAFDSTGNLYITENFRVRRMTTDGSISTIAGNGFSGFAGDGGLAINATVSFPGGGIAVNSKGVAYFADPGNNRIRSLTPLVPAKLAIANGNNQSQPAGTRLQGPLIVSVSDNNGVPVPGVTVSFSVTSGTATLSANTATSLLDGTASVGVTLGGTSGPIAIAASALGLSSVTFNVMATDSPVLTPPDVTAYNINTVAGSFPPEDNIPATAVLLQSPFGVLVDTSANLYISDRGKHRIRKITVDGTSQTFAGTGQPGFSGDGGPANAAQLTSPAQMAIDGQGNIYVADPPNNRVRKIAPDGTISTVAGTGQAGFGGDGGPATAAQLRSPIGIAVDSAGNLFIADSSNFRVRKVTADGAISTIAGTGRPGFAGDGGRATAAFVWPTVLALDASGNLLIAESNNNRVRKIDGNGIITTFAGNGTPSFAGDGGPAASAQLSTPQGLAVDTAGNVYISDGGNYRIRVVSADGTISTFAGNGTPGYSGDGGPALNASFLFPEGLTFDAAGNLFVVDAGFAHIRRIAQSDQTITTVAGASHYAGDGGLATFALLYVPRGLATDSAGNVFIADSGNSVVRKIAIDGGISTVAGAGGYGNAGDGGPATAAQFFDPVSVAVDSDGTVYIADDVDNKVRKVTPDGTITTVAGTGVGGSSGDGGPATSAQLNIPVSVALDAAHNLYISDLFNSFIRIVTPDGNINTFAGNGDPRYNGDGRFATTAALDPRQLAVDGGGNVYVADNFNNRIRKISPSGVITTVAGNGRAGFSGDGGAATDAQLSSPTGVAVDGGGNLYIADRGNNRIRKVSPSGVIVTIAGGTTPGFSGDGGPAGSAQLAGMSDLAIDSSGNLYVADLVNQVIRKLTPSQTGSSGARRK